jgi:hypothetical protein
MATTKPVSEPGSKPPAKRNVDYRWRLREIMAQHGMFRVTDLIPHLADRGIELSVSQLWRIVAQKPERLSLTLLAAFCDIFNTSPGDLIVTTAQNTIHKTADEDTATAELDALRPTRARIQTNR